MISRELYYEYFEPLLAKIVDDVFIIPDDMSEEDFAKGVEEGIYAFCRGKWQHTEENIYPYDKRKISAHALDLVSLCKMLPKFHQPCESHAGTISSLDLVVDYKDLPGLDADETYYMAIMANHFANLLEMLDIAQIQPAKYKGHEAFLIVLNPKLRKYLCEE